MLHKNAFLALAGRLLLSLIFLAAAFGKVTNFEGTVGHMETHGIPLATLLCAGAAALEAAGGIAVLLGYHARRAAASLAVFVLAATLIFHLAPDERLHLLKNLAIIGGLLQVAAWGPGEISLEGKRG